MGITMNKRTRRKFSKEYKAEIVDLVRQADGNAAKVARDVDLTPQTVSSWVRQAMVDDGGGKAEELTTTERAELSKLRKENKDLRMEREFLKKISTWFAKESK